MLRFLLPRPLQLVIDDVGWWRGADDSRHGGPYRTGVNRNHVPADYAALASLGRKLNMRPQAALVLCEWDRADLLRRVPSATWMGADWDNSECVGPWLEEAAAVFADHREHLELTLHGVGHEFWDRGVRSRAEWHDREHRLRPRPAIQAHLDAFEGLLEQNGLGPFPESFVPCAFLHRFGLGEEGLVGALRERGLKYLSTPWPMGRARNPQEDLFGVECGLMTVDRGANGVPWRAFNTLPEGETPGPICGLHWPNVLHPDPARNEEAVERWVAYLRAHDRRPDRMLARNTAECWSQLAYGTGTKLTPREGILELDFSRLDAYGINPLQDQFVLRVVSDRELHFRAEGLELVSIRREEADDCTTLRLRRGTVLPRATLCWQEGSPP